MLIARYQFSYTYVLICHVIPEFHCILIGVEPVTGIGELN